MRHLWLVRHTHVFVIVDYTYRQSAVIPETIYDYEAV